MTSIKKFSNTSKKTNKSTTIAPGTYNSTVVGVDFDDRYRDGAYVIKYEVDIGGKKAHHSEIFVDNPRFTRTRDFYNYLEDNGIDDIEEFKGCCEEIRIKWNFTNSGQRKLTIDSRKFLGFGAQSKASHQYDSSESSDEQC